MSFVTGSREKLRCFTERSKKSLEFPVLSREKRSWREELERRKEKSSQDGVWPESLRGETTDEKNLGYRGLTKKDFLI